MILWRFISFGGTVVKAAVHLSGLDPDPSEPGKLSGGDTPHTLRLQPVDEGQGGLYGTVGICPNENHIPVPDGIPLRDRKSVV